PLPLLGPGGPSMRGHDRAIDRHHRLIPITGSRLDNTFTKIRLGPTPEPLDDTGPPPSALDP
ncbi:MAG: hypothetical protein OXE84_12510, partial [Rhodobacteraceae bacterium]|nr:hypothetical protein [Paracoccaceae bacterium]